MTPNHALQKGNGDSSGKRDGAATSLIDAGHGPTKEDQPPTPPVPSTS